MPQASIRLNGAALVADLSGALWWPARRTLAVADLHLEKGSSHAACGRLLPPYDTAATLHRLAAVLARHPAERVICLGDSFHDGGAVGRLAPRDATALRRLMDGRAWVWIAGNHDADSAGALGGHVRDALVDGPLVFRHAAAAAAEGEVSGHYHPKATVAGRGGRVSAPCFVADGRRLILPAFGAYTGGLDVLDPAIRALLGRRFVVHVLGRRRLHSLPGQRLAC